MSLPPSLTWLQLFPAGAACACEGAPPWLVAKLADVQQTERPRVKVVCDKKWTDLADLPNWDGVVAINCPGTSTACLEAAGFTFARRFAVLPSLENARWFISIDSPAVAAASFSVYSPARKSAHLKKSIARLLARLGVRFYRDQIAVALREPPPLETTLAGLFPGQSIRLALSAGAPEPAINRKASGAVISPRGDVLAFVKIAGSDISRRILEHEAEMLQGLAERNSLSLSTPRQLFAGEIDGRYTTVQSPLLGDVPAAKMTPAHQRFLASLRSGPTKSAAATAMVAGLPARIAGLASPLDLEAILDNILPTLDEMTVSSTIIHGDFAPWNLRSHRGQISAFDWEYGELDGLPLIDETHFTLQLGFQLNGWNPEQAQRCLSELANQAPLGLSFEQVRAIHAVYLLDNIVRLLGEGYAADHDMVSWYRAVLARLGIPKREAALV
jgi:hypothetical protein